MYKIRGIQQLNRVTKMIVVEAERVARRALPGQFVMLRVDETGERVPLTIYRADSAEGTITLIFQEVGKSTIKLGKVKQGDSLRDVLGPLGKPTPIKRYGSVLCVAGGVGVAEIYPVAAALHEAGNAVTSLCGFRDREMVILEQEMRAVSESFYLTTDDGSSGRKGLVTDLLDELLKKHLYRQAFCVGPLVMMKKVSLLTKAKNLPTQVSLNSIMVDGTGMCGSCRVLVNGAVKFACVDGPDFNGHEVDFDDLLVRQNRFIVEEKLSLESCHHDGGCRCENGS